MTTYNVTVAATLDREPSEADAARVGKLVAGEELLMVSVHGRRISVAMSTEGLALDRGLGPHQVPTAILERAWSNLLTEAANAGYSAEQPEALEILSQAETDRRLQTASLPPMVSTAQLAEMCGVTTQRIYELETARKKAAAAGELHELPAPVVPGWYLKAAAERYAATRKRKPGPAPRIDDDPFADPW